MSRRTRDALASVGFAADGHRSHQLSDEDIGAADLVVAMAGEHVAYVRRRHPDAAAKTASIKRLCRDLAPGPPPAGPADRARWTWPTRRSKSWEDVEDPAGGEDEVYVACAKELAASRRIYCPD